jgi:hypothetical protein
MKEQGMTRTELAALFDATDSVAIKRLIEEVRQDTPSHPTAYNRIYSRHNRS